MIIGKWMDRLGLRPGSASFIFSQYRQDRRTYFETVKAYQPPASTNWGDPMSFEPVEADNVLTPEQHAELIRRQNIGKPASAQIPTQRESERPLQMSQLDWQNALQRSARERLDDARAIEEYREMVQNLNHRRLRPFDSKEGAFKSLDEATRMFNQMQFCPMCCRRMVTTALQQRSKGCMEHVLYYIDQDETGGYDLWFVPLF